MQKFFSSCQPVAFLLFALVWIVCGHAGIVQAAPEKPIKMAFDAPVLARMSAFVSNFTETDTGKDVCQIYDAGRAAPQSLIHFGVRHNWLHNAPAFAIDGTRVSIDAQSVARAIEQFFGLKFDAHASVPDAGIAFVDGRYVIAADTPRNGPQATVERVYAWQGELVMTGHAGEKTADERNDGFQVHVKHHVWQGKDSWKLLSYTRHGQSDENMRADYHGGDMAAANALIEKHGLKWRANQPFDWSVHDSDGQNGFVRWNGESPRRITGIYLSGQGIKGILDLAAFGALQEIFCMNNSIEQLYISGCPELKTLVITGNPIPFIDSSRNPNLERLEWDGNAKPEEPVKPETPAPAPVEPEAPEITEPVAEQAEPAEPVALPAEPQPRTDLAAEPVQVTEAVPRGEVESSENGQAVPDVQGTLIPFTATTEPDLSEVLSLIVPEGWHHRNVGSVMEMTPATDDVDDAWIVVEATCLDSRSPEEAVSLFAGGAELTPYGSHGNSFIFATEEAPLGHREHLLVVEAGANLVCRLSWQASDRYRNDVDSVLRGLRINGKPVAE